MDRITAKGKKRKTGYTRKVPKSVLDSILEKLVPVDGNAENYRKGSVRQYRTNNEGMRTDAQTIAQRRADANAIKNILPDMEHAERVLIATILSPRSMSKPDIGFTLDETKFTSDLGVSLIKPIKEYFKDTYKIDTKAPEILRSILMTYGSYPVMVLPESTVDNLIRGGIEPGTESLLQEAVTTESKKAFGFIGSTREASGNDFSIGLEDIDEPAERQLTYKVGTEEIIIDNVTMTDNFNILKRGRLKDALRRHVVSRALNRNRTAWKTGLEDAVVSKANIKDIHDYYASNVESSNAATGLRIIPPPDQTNNPSVGHPLLIDLPPESVIPAHKPGRPEQQLGFFIVIDPKTGDPISIDNSRDYYGEMRATYDAKVEANAKDDFSTTLENIQANMGMNTSKTMDNEQRLLENRDLYTSILETNSINALANGAFTDDLVISLSEDLVNVMLWRQMKNRQTQLLFVPRELLTYFAFEYDERGFGLSLLHKTRILHNIRVALFFANAMGNIENSRPRKRITVTVDEDDTDPYKSFDEIQQMVINKEQVSSILGGNIQSPSTLARSLAEDAYEFSLNANGNAGASSEIIDYEDIQSNINVGDQSYADDLRAMGFMSMGLQPELFDPKTQADFATTITTGNLMLARMVTELQDKYIAFQTEVVKNFARNSSIIRDEIAEQLKGNKKAVAKEFSSLKDDELVDAVIDAIRLVLPEPDTDRIDKISDELTKYAEALDTALDAYVTEDIYPEGQGKEAVDTFKACLKAKYMRDYMAHNNILPQLNELTTLGEHGPSFDITNMMEQLQKTLGKTMAKFFDKMKPKEEEPVDDGSAPDDTGDDLDDGADAGDDADGDDMGDDDLDDLDDDGSSGEDDDEDGDDDDSGDADDDDSDDESDDTKDKSLDDSHVKDLEGDDI